MGLRSSKRPRRFGRYSTYPNGVASQHHLSHLLALLTRSFGRFRSDSILVNPPGPDHSLTVECGISHLNKTLDMTYQHGCLGAALCDCPRAVQYQNEQSSRVIPRRRSNDWLRSTVVTKGAYVPRGHGAKVRIFAYYRRLHRPHLWKRLGDGESAFTQRDWYTSVLRGYKGSIHTHTRPAPTIYHWRPPHGERHQFLST